MGLKVHEEREEAAPVNASSLKAGQIARSASRRSGDVYIKTDESTLVHLFSGVQYTASDFNGIDFYPVPPGTTLIVS